AAGPQGPAGATGPTGPAAEGGVTTNGEGGVPTGPVVLSSRATKGLQIAARKGYALALGGAPSDPPAPARHAGSPGSPACDDCGGCHDGTDATTHAPLGGGLEFDLDNGAKVFARNLTTDPTTGLKITQKAFMDAMRTGRDDVDGSKLLVMPWEHFRWMTEADL